MGDRLAAVVVAVPFLLGAASGADSGGDVVFRFEDPAIVESSGLVVQGDAFVTTNDSGDSGRVFVVDGGSGQTVGVTTWSESPEDVEALAPGGPGHVWVGDIGDNEASRDDIEVARVRLGVGERSVAAETFTLAYPDGAVDAETLLRHPVTGRLYVASKVVFGGRLYAAPAQLTADQPNPLDEVGRILPLATDGAFFPDGRHVVLRDYGRAVVYTFPQLEVIADVTLPEQQQGEGIAVADDGTLYASSEGLHAPVLEVPLPDDVRAAVSSSSSTDAAPTPPPGSRQDVELPEEDSGDRPVWPWFLTGWLGLTVIVVLLLALRRRPNRH